MPTSPCAAPRAAGLKRFIPPSDVTGLLALIIAILTFANEFAFDWVAPVFRQSGGAAAKHAPTPQKEQRRIKLSSDILHGESQAGRDRIYTLKGSWEGGPADRLWLQKYIPNSSTFFTSGVTGVSRKVFHSV